METQTKIGKVVEEFEGRDVRIERVRVLDLLVPRLVDDLHDEVFAVRVGCVIESTVVPLGIVLPFRLMYFRTCRTLLN